jgi:hypothetical protein
MAVMTESRLAGGILSTLSIGTVLAGMAAIDETFRRQLSGIVSDPSSALGLADTGTQQLTRVLHPLMFQVSTHVPLVLFGIGALVLVGLLLRP